ncbi:MAG: hypothetical protein A2Z25_02805 [Planctomycetes bacterium RBG_16_55_9]|nr:MAG: hypothetical protein A2Z25_02805 [Planctomycetes bacterium RBG_16_55_9]
MLRNIKFRKVAVVVFLTVLIWVWTDLALNETYSVSGAKIVLMESSPEIWISFDGERFTDINNIELQGPASKITNIKRKVENHSFSLLFPLDAEVEIADANRPLNVQDFLQKSAQLQDSGLVVETCLPSQIRVSVARLTERPLAVECHEESGAPLSVGSTVEPATVNVLVPDNWPPGDKARVVLTPSEIDQAKKIPIRKKAYILLADGQTRESSTAVQIRIPPEEERLKRFTDITATIGICLSENLVGRYDVELVNRTSGLMDLIAIRATNEARAKYEGQDKPRMTLYIYDRDEAYGQDVQGREVQYNFPEDLVRKGEIFLDQTPATARFRLIPIPSAENP